MNTYVYRLLFVSLFRFFFCRLVFYSVSIFTFLLFFRGSGLAFVCLAIFFGTFIVFYRLVGLLCFGSACLLLFFLHVKKC